MLHLSRMTGNEREVLHAALKAYDTAQRDRAARAHRPDIIADAEWRRHQAYLLLEQIDSA